MKKGKTRYIVMDYIAIILSFLTFLLSLIIYYTFFYRIGAIFYFVMMIITAVMIGIGFRNLKKDIN